MNWEEFVRERRNILGHQQEEVTVTIKTKEGKDKGKLTYQKKLTIKLTIQQQRTAMINLEKRREFVSNGGSEGDDSSSSSDSGEASSEENNKSSAKKGGANQIPNQTEEIELTDMVTKKRRGQKRVYSAKKHGMRTRNANNCECQEQSSAQARMQKKIRTKENRNLEEEIAKVIEIGVALGFNFNGREEEIGGVVAQRELEDEERLKNVPWCIGGDFNSVLDPSERISKGSHGTSTRSFQAFVRQAMVMDILLNRLEFMWPNFREDAAWAQLDRFLLSPELLIWFPKLKQKGVCRSLSDHNAIGIREPKVDWGPSLFRFLNCWMENKELMAEAIAGWENCKVGGCRISVLKAKVKAVKVMIKNWLVKNNKRNQTIEQIEKQLAAIDRRAEKEGWSDKLRKSRVTIVLELWRSIRREEQSWRQKSRVWLKEGDRNTRFFHLMAKRRIVWDWQSLKDSSIFVKVVSALFKIGSRSEKVIYEGVKVVIGDGSIVRFWHEIMVGSVALKEAFPRVFALASDKEGFISDCGNWLGNKRVRVELQVLQQSEEDGGSCFSSLLLDSKAVVTLYELVRCGVLYGCFYKEMVGELGRFSSIEQKCKSLGYSLLCCCLDCVGDKKSCSV
ncbi:hypothetical protein Dsin_015024 [Dipteronia sinensis]|uniref:Reverse transcriptase n=1 Tax=Dipteronia sinensis TaxID=43782 RepID=A0AAE0AP62_9ROSI|nr:hypothetical protein Dsin_015024 [Dipteronia sinensis]